jgi:hypothetical protein
VRAGVGAPLLAALPGARHSPTPLDPLCVTHIPEDALALLSSPPGATAAQQALVVQHTLDAVAVLLSAEPLALPAQQAAQLLAALGYLSFDDWTPAVAVITISIIDRLRRRVRRAPVVTIGYLPDRGSVEPMPVAA